MPRKGRFASRLDIGLTQELAAALKAEAARRGLSIAVLARDLLTEALAERAAIEGRDALDKALRRAIKPAEDRLAGLIVKAAVAAATAMYLNTQALADLGKHDAVDLYHQARKKAAAYLREPEQNE